MQVIVKRCHCLQAIISYVMDLIQGEDNSPALHLADSSLLLQFLSSIESCLDRTAGKHASDMHEAASQVQVLCLACLEAKATVSYPLQSPVFQAAALVLQRAFEVSGKPTAHVSVWRVLKLLDGGAGMQYAGLAALLLLLECHSPVLRRVLKKHASEVFRKVLASLHSTSMTPSHAQLQAHAAGSLALRCLESMAAQKADFRHIGPALHQVTAGISACTHALGWEVRAAAADAAVGARDSRVPVVGIVQIVGACCSLITALLRHRPEAAEAVAAALPWLSRQWLQCLPPMATEPGAQDTWRCDAYPLNTCLLSVCTTSLCMLTMV